MMNSKKEYGISILIVNYNAEDFIETTIRSVCSELKNKNINFEVLIIDNASTDNATQIIKNITDIDIKLFESTINHGFAKGNNILADHAKYNILMLLNNDTKIISLNEVCRLIAEEENKTIITSDIYNEDMTLQKNEFSYPTFSKLILELLLLKNLIKKLIKYFPKQINVENSYFSGCFLVIRKQDFLNLNGFDENFIFYHEECDFFMRAQRQNFKKIKTNDVIIHYGGGNKPITEFAFKNYYLGLALLFIKHKSIQPKVIFKVYTILFSFRMILLKIAPKINYNPFYDTYKSGSTDMANEAIALHQKTLFYIKNKILDL